MKAPRLPKQTIYAPGADVAHIRRALQGIGATPWHARTALRIYGLNGVESALATVRAWQPANGAKKCR